MTRQAPNEIVYDFTTLFLLSRCLHVVAELGIADALDDAPLSTEDLARKTRTSAPALHRVLRLLASRGVFEYADGRYAHTDASRLLRDDHPQSMRAYVRMMGSPMFWNSFGLLEYSVRTELPAASQIDPEGIFAYLAKHPAESGVFNEAMKARSHAFVAAVLAAYDFSRFHRIADIGGGKGHLLRAILEKAPDSVGVLFDLKHVVAEVSDRMSGRLTVKAGDFFADSLPVCDAYLLMNVIHDWNDHKANTLLSAIRRDAPRDSTLLLIEMIVPETSTPHVSKALDITMLAVAGGRERTRLEFRELLESAGFRLSRVVDTASPYSILEAVPK